MIEPMLVRLIGCFVFAGLLAALVLAVDAPRHASRSDVVASAEISHRVQQNFTRP